MLSTEAGERAFRKWPHQGPKGSLELDLKPGSTPSGGNLLTAYVRVKGERFGDPTRWTKVGTVCLQCRAYWPAP